MIQRLLRQAWEKIREGFSDQVSGQILIFSMGVVTGLFIFPIFLQFEISSFLTELRPEFIGIVFTVIILNRWAEWRSAKELKEQLYSNLHSYSNDAVLNALHRLRDKGWLKSDYFADKDLNRANWEGAYIGGLDFEKAILDGANFIKVTTKIGDDDKPVNFKGANLSQANLQGAIFEKANLEGANLISAKLQGANLDWTNLEGAYLMEANLEGADLAGANLEGAYLADANLDNVIWGNQDGKYSATLPDGTAWTSDSDMERFTNMAHSEFQSTRDKINTIREKQGRYKI